MSNYTTTRVLDECPLQPNMGAIIGGGVVALLQARTLSRTEILLREVVQNSYDARIKDLPVYFSMRAFHFSPEQYNSFNLTLNGDDRTESFYRKHIRKNINPNMLNIEISDINTTGLIGDTEPTVKTIDQNFANFVYFTGAVKGKDAFAGGAFGFGKSSLFVYSRARTIAVYTRVCLNKIQKYYQSRFIVISSDERITGSNSDRCWWGEKKRFTNGTVGEYAAPILGDDADSCARSFGFNVFEQDQTGTKILIINASPDILPKDQFGNEISIDRIFKEKLPKYIVHWYWNKLVLKEPDIKFSLQYENEDIPIDDPRKVYPYNKFYQAYKRYIENKKKGAVAVNQKTFSHIVSEHPQASLGYTALYCTPVMRMHYDGEFEVFKDSDPVIAYMRGIGHIVFYDKVSLHSDNLEATCYGVFQTDRKSKYSPNGKEGEIDQYFRGIETATHDEWVHDPAKYKWNFFKRVESSVNSLVRDNCVQDTQQINTSDLSVTIQRTLGTKLMPHSVNIGTPIGQNLKDTAISRDSKSKRASVKFSGKQSVGIEKGCKILGLEFKVSIKDHPVILKEITPIIKTIDDSTERIVDNDMISFSHVEIVNPKDQKDVRKIGVGSGKINNLRIDKTQTVIFKFICKRDCAFDVSIDWEEIDE